MSMSGRSGQWQGAASQEYNHAKRQPRTRGSWGPPNERGGDAREGAVSSGRVSGPHVAVCAAVAVAVAVESFIGVAVAAASVHHAAERLQPHVPHVALPRDPGPTAWLPTRTQLARPWHPQATPLTPPPPLKRLFPPPSPPRPPRTPPRGSCSARNSNGPRQATNSAYPARAPLGPRPRRPIRSWSGAAAGPAAEALTPMPTTGVRAAMPPPLLLRQRRWRRRARRGEGSAARGGRSSGALCGARRRRRPGWERKWERPWERRGGCRREGRAHGPPGRTPAGGAPAAMRLRTGPPRPWRRRPWCRRWGLLRSR